MINKVVNGCRIVSKDLGKTAVVTYPKPKEDGTRFETFSGCKRSTGLYKAEQAARDYRGNPPTEGQPKESDEGGQRQEQNPVSVG